MKITASVDSKLGDRTLKRGKTYDIKETEAKHLLRAGLGRRPKKDTKVEETVEAANVDTPANFQPGEEPATTDTSGSTSARSTRRVGK